MNKFDRASHLIVPAIWLIAALVHQGIAGKTQMKVVDEPSNYGMNWGGGVYNAGGGTDSSPKLKMRVDPSGFSGPPHLQELLGHCFSLTDDNYKYEFCPFYNVSQHEESLRWNPYHGILGVWQEWEIENNTFVSMVMSEGDSCGTSGFRSAKILLECGEENSVEKVSEPSTCHYQVHFHTPLVCHPQAMLVYPTLPLNLRQHWNELEGRLLNEEITQQGYKKFLNKIFEEAGYMLPEAKRKEVSEQAKETDIEAAKPKMGDFDSLFTCSEEYKKLHEEVESLKTLLESHGISPNDADKGKKAKEEEVAMMDYDSHDHHYDYEYGHH